MRRQAMLLLAIPVMLALPIAAAFAQTLELPLRKSGLWEITSTPLLGLPSTTVHTCVDPGTDRDLMEVDLGLAPPLPSLKCNKLTAKRDDQTYVIDTDCTIGQLVLKTKTVITGNLSSAYTMRTEARLDGVADVLATHSDAKWKSADCPGLKPGDISLSGNLSINIKEVKLLFDSSAQLIAQLPPPRPGQWEVRIVTEMPTLPGLPHTFGPISLPPSQMCIDAATYRDTMQVGLIPAGCQSGDIKREGTEWTLADRCEFGGTVIGMKISGDFQSTITLRVEETIEGVFSSPLKTIQTRTAHWVSEVCTDGMVPGDIILMGGQKISAAPLADLEKFLQQTSPEDFFKMLKELDKSMPQLLQSLEKISKMMESLPQSLPQSDKKPPLPTDK